MLIIQGVMVPDTPPSVRNFTPAACFIVLGVNNCDSKPRGCESSSCPSSEKNTKAPRFRYCGLSSNWKKLLRVGTPDRLTITPSIGSVTVNAVASATGVLRVTFAAPGQTGAPLELAGGEKNKVS